MRWRAWREMMVLQGLQAEAYLRHTIIYTSLGWRRNVGAQRHWNEEQNSGYSKDCQAPTLSGNLWPKHTFQAPAKAEDPTVPSLITGFHILWCAETEKELEFKGNPKSPSEQSRPKYTFSTDKSTHSSTYRYCDEAFTSGPRPSRTLIWAQPTYPAIYIELKVPWHDTAHANLH